MSPRAAHRLKLGGFVISIVSVALLAVPAWAKARDDPALFVCLMAGLVTSIGGQLFRLVANAAEGPKE